jgi:hypothetical protein
MNTIRPVPDFARCGRAARASQKLAMTMLSKPRRIASSGASMPPSFGHDQGLAGRPVGGIG